MVNELLKQILGELKDLKSDISSLKENQAKMQEDISSLKENQVRIQEDISKMQEDISSLKENQVKMQEDISELKQGQVRLETKLDEVSNKLDDLEAKNAQRHIEVNGKLDKITDDIEFIKHKEFENEQDIFKIKKKLAG
ncbi:hypothetical protein [Caloranaerobacter sp. TR13]|uniref:hypothetical protein n=1 Tax=Caloranaerobacter sp. TR13 TaxID=1302151 RepID=UPI00128E1E43|nr:hypothetical protein [Caloranaerobacter sp. TR13]